jgi:mono/diheme cytochrome c family protein
LARAITLFGVIILAVMALLSSTYTGHPENPPFPEYWINRGKTVYLEQCAECHQVDGGGWSHLYPKLAGNPLVTLADAEPVINTVLYGQGSMMSFQHKIPGDDIAAVLSYIRNAWGNSASPVSPRQVH